MFFKKTFCLVVALAAGALVWVVFGAFMRSMSSSVLLVGSLNGVASLIGGVLVNVAAEKFLGISDEADV